jgi:hypothetical protein
MEKFLDFWSHYNAAIIECLVALILISVIYIAYRTFFGPRGPDAFDTATVGGAGVDTAQIEKTLQKILEQQSVAKSGPAATAAAHSGDKSPASAELIHEVSHLKKTLEDKDRQIATLKEQADTSARALASASVGAAAPVAAATAGSASSSGFTEAEREELLAKIKELEARLAEYEIISEDIADVSFFKEENARLNRELEAMKAGGAGTSAPAAAPVIAPPALEVVAAAPAPNPEPVAAPAAVEPVATPEAAAVSAPEASLEAANAIDDSLMAEFARAVEGQKEGTLEQPSKSDEDAKLLEEFENFSKKS